MLHKVFVPIKENDFWNSFEQHLSYIPHKNDAVSFSPDGPVYLVDETLFNCFDCEYKVEIFVHQIRP